MSRVVALLLIPLCLLGQPMPHAHSVAEHDQRSKHDGRAHIHLGHSHHHGHHAHGDHHHHGDEAPLQSVSELPEHDADAIFLGDFHASGSLKKVDVPQCPLMTALLWSWLTPILVDVDQHSSYVLSPPDPLGGTPVYLKTTSLRI